MERLQPAVKETNSSIGIVEANSSISITGLVQEGQIAATTSTATDIEVRQLCRPDTESGLRSAQGGSTLSSLQQDEVIVSSLPPEKRAKISKIWTDVIFLIVLIIALQTQLAVSLGGFGGTTGGAVSSVFIILYALLSTMGIVRGILARTS